MLFCWRQRSQLVSKNVPADDVSHLMPRTSTPRLGFRWSFPTDAKWISPDCGIHFTAAPHSLLTWCHESPPHLHLNQKRENKKLRKNVFRHGSTNKGITLHQPPSLLGCLDSDLKQSPAWTVMKHSSVSTGDVDSENRSSHGDNPSGMSRVFPPGLLHLPRDQQSK